MAGEVTNLGPDRQSVAGRGSVLVADDDPSITRMVRLRLEAAGYEVLVAEDGRSALEAVLRRPFDVVLSDIQMPGVTGIELLSVVRAHDADVPVILMTAAPSVQTAIEAVDLGALQYLSKPVSGDVLLKAIERAVRLHHVARMKRDALKVIADGEASDSVALGASFERALQTMWMAFQPIVDAKHHRVLGYEALMRTREASLPHPGAVLGAAERLGRLPELGRRTRDLSAAAFAQAPDDVLLFVNLHTRDLLDPTLFDADASLSTIAHRVVLEVTERMAIHDVKDIHDRIGQLRARGFRIAVDDLGAGYAGLSSFVALEPDIVKLDMSLVRDVHQSSVRKRIVASMTAVCKDLGMQVVAEGIEVVGERDSLRELGCDLLQGYLFAKPGPPFPVAEMVA